MNTTQASPDAQTILAADNFEAAAVFIKDICVRQDSLGHAPIVLLAGSTTGTPPRAPACTPPPSVSRFPIGVVPQRLDAKGSIDA